MPESSTEFPLIEAIFELKWELASNNAGLLTDPNYSLIVGKLHNTVSAKYPIHRPLPPSSVPPEMAPYVIQHQFRKDEDRWPLYQIGLGVLTYNEVNNEVDTYDWDSFFTNTSELVKNFKELYPNNLPVKISGLNLHYINGIPIDLTPEFNILDHIKQKLGIDIKFPRSIFERTNTIDKPFESDIKVTYPHSNPNGNMTIRLAPGINNNRNSLIVELGLISLNQDTPQNLGDIISWIDAAHKLSKNLYRILFIHE